MIKNLSSKNNHDLLTNIDKILFISLSNYAYIDMTENHIISLQKSGINNYIAFVLDEQSYEYLSNKNYNISLFRNINELEYLQFGSKKFNNISFMRWYIIYILLKNNYTVWYLDIDTVVMYDLNILISNLNKYDICLQDDVNAHCTGCMLLFPKVETIRLCDHMIKNRTNKENDQIFFNSFLKTQNMTKHLTIMPGNKPISLNLYNFDRVNFPNGLLYFNDLHTDLPLRNAQSYFRNSNKSVYFVHANWMTGKDTKIEAFKKKKLWYVYS